MDIYFKNILVKFILCCNIIYKIILSYLAEGEVEVNVTVLRPALEDIGCAISMIISIESKSQLMVDKAKCEHGGFRDQASKRPHIWGYCTGWEKAGSCTWSAAWGCPRDHGQGLSLEQQEGTDSQTPGMGCKMER